MLCYPSPKFVRSIHNGIYIRIKKNPISVIHYKQYLILPKETNCGHRTHHKKQVFKAKYHDLVLFSQVSFYLEIYLFQEGSFKRHVKYMSEMFSNRIYTSYFYNTRDSISSCSVSVPDC